MTLESGPRRERTATITFLVLAALIPAGVCGAESPEPPLPRGTVDGDCRYDGDLEERLIQTVGCIIDEQSIE